MNTGRRLSALLLTAALAAGACSDGGDVTSEAIAGPTGEAAEGSESESGSGRTEAGGTTADATDSTDESIGDDMADTDTGTGTGTGTSTDSGNETGAENGTDNGTDGDSPSGDDADSTTSDGADGIDDTATADDQDSNDRGSDGGTSNDDTDGDESNDRGSATSSTTAATKPTASTTTTPRDRGSTTTRPGQDPEPTGRTTTTRRPGADPEPDDDAPVEVRENRGSTPRPAPVPDTVPSTPNADERQAMADQDDTTTAELAGDASNDELNGVDRAVIAASSCTALATEVVDGYQTVLDRLGDADRTDYRAVDEAYETFGAGGSLIQSRADELGCTPDGLTASICRATGRLTSSGQAGDDLLASITASC